MFPQSTRQTVHSTGNDTFDKFLGGGLLNLSLNIFERQGPSSRLLDTVLNGTMASAALASMSNLIVVNFNTVCHIDPSDFLKSVPNQRKVKSELMYKDVRGRSGRTHIKIAWRYYSRSSSPPESLSKMDQVDFGQLLSSEKSTLGHHKIINVTEDFSMPQFLLQLTQTAHSFESMETPLQIIIKDILSPFSPYRDDPSQLVEFLYLLRCFARTLKQGSILVSYDIDQFNSHPNLREHIYNIADSVVSFYSYETGECHLTGYKNVEGTLQYLKVPKINSFGSHFQRELSDWGYRFTKNHKFFVVDELSLPPQDDDEQVRTSKREIATSLTDIEHKRRPMEQVGPLEDFKKVAETILSR